MYYYVGIKGRFCPGGALHIKKMLALVEHGRVAPEKLLNCKFEGFERVKDA